MAEHSTRRGFLTIDLLVTIGIIAILSSIALLTVSSFAQKGRDQERRTELKALEVALRLYKDANGRYPAGGCGAGPWDGGSAKFSSPGPGTATWYQPCDDYIPGLAPDYIPILPKDPNETLADSGYMYIVNSTGSDYKILAHGTVESAWVNAGDDMSRCPASCGQSYCSYYTYAVYSAGATCW